MVGLIYFGWDFNRAFLWDMLLTSRTQVYHSVDDTVLGLSSGKPCGRLESFKYLNKYHKQGGIVSLSFSLPLRFFRFLNTCGTTFKTGTFFPALMNAYTLP